MRLLMAVTGLSWFASTCVFARVPAQFVAQAGSQAYSPIEARRHQLTQLGASLPFQRYSPAFVQLTVTPMAYFVLGPDGKPLEPRTLVADGALDMTPYTGGWLPVGGNPFNGDAAPLAEQELLTDGVIASHRDWLAPPLRQALAAAEAMALDARPAEYKFNSVQKLAALEDRLHARSGKRFDFKALVDPGTDYPEKAPFLEKYFSAHSAFFLDLQTFYEPGAPNWWGFCDRLALGNLDRASGRLLAAVDGAMCGDMPVGRGEERDMISLMHTMPKLKTYGVNRGNITEEQVLSPEQLLWEEISGVRPLMPDTLAGLLREQVRAGGNGLVFDESSSPDPRDFAFSAIWNRPVFSFMDVVETQETTWQDADFALLSRYAPALVGKHVGPAPAVVAAEAALKAAAATANEKYANWLEGEFFDRIAVLKVEVHSPVPAHAQPAEAKVAYDAARTAFKARLAELQTAVAALKAAVKTRSDLGPLTVRMHQLTMRFPRERPQDYDTTNNLYQRRYLYVEPVAGGETMKPTWWALQGDYPPDLVRVPENAPNENMSRLAEAFSTCTPMAAIRATVAAVAEAPTPHAAATALAAAKSCATRYLDEPALRKNLGGLAPADGARIRAAFAACAPPRTKVAARTAPTSQSR